MTFQNVMHYFRGDVTRSLRVGFLKSLHHCVTLAHHQCVVNRGQRRILKGDSVSRARDFPGRRSKKQDLVRAQVSGYHKDDLEGAMLQSNLRALKHMAHPNFNNYTMRFVQ